MKRIDDQELKTKMRIIEVFILLFLQFLVYYTVVLLLTTSFMKVVDAEMLAFSQGVTRRGSYAAYLHISHPEIEEYLDVRKPTGGDINRKSTNLHHAVVIPDSFMKLICL